MENFFAKAKFVSRIATQHVVQHPATQKMISASVQCVEKAKEVGSQAAYFVADHPVVKDIGNSAAVQNVVEKLSQVADQVKEAESNSVKFVIDHPAVQGVVQHPSVKQAVEHPAVQSVANSSVVQYFANHPGVIAQAAILIAPGIVFGPILGVLGFGAAGPVAGSIAAGIQGPATAARGAFAVAQSAAMGGYGIATLAWLTRGVVMGVNAVIGGVRATNGLLQEEQFPAIDPEDTITEGQSLTEELEHHG